LPDLRGYFLRGNGGVDVGRTLRTVQADTFKAHSHPNTLTQALLGFVAWVSGTHVAYTAATGSPDLQKSGTALGINNANDTGGGTETRPVNMSVNYIIKT
jgi:hypothetical protein